jgi:hypothetical protein
MYSFVLQSYWFTDTQKQLPQSKEEAPFSEKKSGAFHPLQTSRVENIESFCKVTRLGGHSREANKTAAVLSVKRDMIPVLFPTLNLAYLLI